LGFGRHDLVGRDDLDIGSHPRLREVCLVDGTMQRVRDQDWAAFVANQIDLLVREGFSREAVLHYYYIQ
jgi:hypothetical protein